MWSPFLAWLGHREIPRSSCSDSRPSRSRAMCIARPRVSGRYDIARPRLAGAVRTLVDAGWRVEAEGKLHRQAGNFASGVDWFDLQGELDFVSATLRELLRALRRG